MNQSEPIVASFVGAWQSSLLEGEARIDVGCEDVCALCGGRAHAILFADIRSIEMTSWSLVIDTEQESITVSRMGQQLIWLYRKLRDAFNRCVLAALLVNDSRLFKAHGTFRILEEGRALVGNAASPDERADIQLFPDCLCILPPDCRARRIPLAFVNEAYARDYALHLHLTTGESYEIGQLGFELEPLARRIEACRHNLTLATAKLASAIDPALAPNQSAQLGCLMMNGMGAPLSVIAACAPSFPAALEAFLVQREQALFDFEQEGESPAAPACLPSGCFASLRRICPPELLLVGMKDPSANGTDGANGTTSASATASATDAENLPTCDLWFAALSPDRSTALVEYALADGQQSATYLYREPTGALPATSTLPLATLISRAQEAMGSDRARMRLSDDELRRPENRDASMALLRTPVLRALRQRFAGRIIHKNPSDWERQIKQAL